MNWAKITDEEWREFQAIPDQGHSHRAWVDRAIRKRLDQLRTDEAVARVAQIFLSVSSSEDNARVFAGATIDALIGEEKPK